jgi:LacI family transcriptional regulator
MSVTTTEIAKRLGLSQPTVSRILNNKHGHYHAPETRRRVLEMAAEMNYRPNAIARALQKGRTETIAVASTFTGSLTDGNLYFAELIDGILSSARRHDYNVLLRATNKPEKLRTAIMGDGQADGCIWVAPRVDEPLLADLARGDAPLVVVAARVEKASACVLADNRQAIEIVLDHLQSLGHRDLAFIFETNLEGLYETSERMAAFKSLCAERGLSGRLTHLWDMRQMLAAPRESIPTAILGWNDNVAMAAIKDAHEAGMRVPEDISIVGFDSTHFCDTATPTLTSVYQPVREIGHNAVELLLDSIREGAEETHRQRVRIFPCRLDIRGSTGPARTSS